MLLYLYIMRVCVTHSARSFILYGKIYANSVFRYRHGPGPTGLAVSKSLLLTLSLSVSRESQTIPRIPELQSDS